MIGNNEKKPEAFAGVFKPIDIESWDRGELFKLYTDVWGAITYSFTKKIDVTEFVANLKARKLKFTPSVIYAFTRAVNNQMNFKIRSVDGVLGEYDIIHPSYPVLSDSGNMTYHSIPFNYDYDAFYASYTEDMKKFPANGKYPLAHTVTPPPNNYIISVMNFLSFDGDSFYLKYSKNYFAPFFVLGQYEHENDRIMLPVSITMNHACADGYHLKVLFDDIDRCFKEFERM